MAKQQIPLPAFRITTAIYLALVIITVVVFAQTLSFDFINLDDNHYVTANKNVHKGLSTESVKWAFTTDHGGLYIPMTWLSLMLDYELFGLNPGGFHLTNLLLHIANTLLLFTVLRKMTGTLWRSACVAALFAIHPLHVESVVWVTERKDVLSSFFMMLMLLAYVDYVRRPHVFNYILTLVLFFLGLLAKPMLVTLPFALLLLDYWPLARLDIKVLRPDGDMPQQKASENRLYFKNQALIWIEKIPMLALSALFVFLAFKATAPYNTRLSFDLLPFKTRLANALFAYATYIRKMVWPNDLAVFYPHPGDELSLGIIVVAGLLLSGITVFTLLVARRMRFAPVGWFWFLGTLVPVIGLTQTGLQGMADRFTYIPLIGLFIVIVWSAEFFF